MVIGSSTKTGASSAQTPPAMPQGMTTFRRIAPSNLLNVTLQFCPLVKLQALSKQRCLGHLLAEIKKIEEKNKFAPESVDGMFCQELKTVLKRTI
jgi:hypothetical protein